MAWSISISQEGWEAVYDACHQQTKGFLFKAVNKFRKDNRQKTILLKHYPQISQQKLAEEAFEAIRKTNTCDNGGYHYWIDKEGFYKIHID